MKDSVYALPTMRPANKAGLMLNKGRCIWYMRPILCGTSKVGTRGANEVALITFDPWEGRHQ
jgi:hypothetical protein